MKLHPSFGSEIKLILERHSTRERHTPSQANVRHLTRTAVVPMKEFHIALDHDLPEQKMDETEHVHGY
eukprot:9489714-Ditylum_brightwellii.AAC.1